MFWSRSKRRIESTDPGLASAVLKFFRNSPRDESFTFSFLVDRVRPTSPEKLAIVLSELVLRRAIDRIVRVYSRRTGGGIGDFESTTSVPLEIYDRRADDTFEVAPSDVQILFAPHSEDRVLEHSSAER